MSLAITGIIAGRSSAKAGFTRETKRLIFRKKYPSADHRGISEHSSKNTNKPLNNLQARVLEQKKSI